jgi:hypothetical protein
MFLWLSLMTNSVLHIALFHLTLPQTKEKFTAFVTEDIIVK